MFNTFLRLFAHAHSSDITIHDGALRPAASPNGSYASADTGYFARTAEADGGCITFACSDDWCRRLILLLLAGDDGRFRKISRQYSALPIDMPIYFAAAAMCCIFLPRHKRRVPRFTRRFPSDAALAGPISDFLLRIKIDRHSPPAYKTEAFIQLPVLPIPAP